MAKCDEGYRCDVCGDDVTSIIDSDLYLRFVLGRTDAEQLHLATDRHLRCNPTLAQFIDDERFSSINVEGELSRSGMDPDFVAREVQWVTRGYQRLHEINATPEPRDVTQYPLPEVIDRFRKDDSKD